VSWQLSAFALVALALALAFWWYERSRPPAKLVAVIATLAALAALGRDAFAAVPDVKPTTAIVLVAGVAFGAGPGFAVGAIAALSSNILLGEGPWTPWQMLGWGLVGLLGGGLGTLTARRLPRVALALACAGCAEVFNLLVDLYTWTGAGSHTLAAFGVVLGSAVVFDTTHVIASLLFGFAFGPALLRMLLRVRARLEVSWEAPMPSSAARAPAARVGASATGALLLLPLLAFSPAPTSRAAHHARARPGRTSVRAVDARLDVSRELSFLARAQNPDGGFGEAPGRSSAELYSAWVAIGVAASGRDPLSMRRNGHTVLSALRGDASSLHGAGDLERTILALHACGASVHSLSGTDPVARLLRLRASDGSFSHLVNLTAFAVFALRAAGYSASNPTVLAAGAWLARQQEGNGGFGFAARGAGSDVDDTAAAIQALLDASRRSPISHAVAFLAHAQNRDGGFPQQPGSPSNAQSTAWAVQGLLAAGRNVEALKREGSRSPLGYLQSLIAPDGSVRYSRTGAQTPVWVTAQALTAFAHKPFPIGR
jgi:energy-coupling factor transport system substrate-specific component